MASTLSSFLAGASAAPPQPARLKKSMAETAMERGRSGRILKGLDAETD
jgi:hypothetical protein